LYLADQLEVKLDRESIAAELGKKAEEKVILITAQRAERVFQHRRQEGKKTHMATNPRGNDSGG